MTQNGPKIAPAEKNSTDISAASATFCISACTVYILQKFLTSSNLHNSAMPQKLPQMYNAQYTVVIHIVVC